ncbi:hypothetical protein SDC9_180082 [bioreactor metagenome]|uniref:Uncharacterized protein n=1 Tax=bioreactor metagenome TaxID=1076179 RepID=A0A645H2R2_9ZZZZ
MSLITMIYVFLNAQRFQGEYTSDTQQDFLFQTVLPIAAIQLMSDRAVELAIHFIVRIEQIQGYAPHIYFPHISMYYIIDIGNIYHKRLSVRIIHPFQRKRTKILCFVISNLLSVNSQ